MSMRASMTAYADRVRLNVATGRADDRAKEDAIACFRAAACILPLDAVAHGRPAVGMTVTVRGVACEIIRVRPAGTVDVVATDGSDRAWRVSGLGFRRGWR